MLDSGVHVGHPHLQSVAGGVAITPDGDGTDYVDTLGHGTAVGALIHHLAPEADLFAVKIFDRRLATSLSVVLRAIDWCFEHQINIINLSLGTTNEEHRRHFASAVERVLASGAVLVSAYEVEGVAMLPGSLPGVVGVVADSACDHGDYRVIDHERDCIAACPYPREIEGVPRERNLKGVSFAVAHISALIARKWNTVEAGTDWFKMLSQEQDASLFHPR
jgi:subtilisin family serine protease